MCQQRFSRCTRCGRTYTEVVKSGYGHLYCPECGVEVRRIRARERQRRYRQRKAGR
jgi:predicted RNA-binding Zn-ribbon protein involved in translation (DUF1610 family)